MIISKHSAILPRSLFLSLLYIRADRCLSRFKLWWTLRKYRQSEDAEATLKKRKGHLKNHPTRLHLTGRSNCANVSKDVSVQAAVVSETFRENSLETWNWKFRIFVTQTEMFILIENIVFAGPHLGAIVCVIEMRQHLLLTLLSRAN